MHDRKDDPVGTSEMKAFGEELLATGARYIDAGRRWLSERRDQMGASRSGPGDHDRGGHHRDHDPARDARGHGPYRRGDDTSDRARSAWLGGGHERDGERRYERGNAYRGPDDVDSPYQRTRFAGHGDPAAAVDWRRQQRWSRDEDDRSSDWGPRHADAYNDVDYLSGAPDFGHFGAYDREGRAGRVQRQATPGRGGGWRGVGPKGYRRADARITEDLCEQLMHDDAIDARELTVRVEDGVVTLEGTVDQRWVKYRVEDLAEQCAGVRDVDNRVRVRRHDPGAGSTDAHSGTGDLGAAAYRDDPGAAGSLSSSAHGGSGPAAGTLAGGAPGTGSGAARTGTAGHTPGSPDDAGSR